jgi:hypothetical protein
VRLFTDMKIVATLPETVTRPSPFTVAMPALLVLKPTPLASGVSATSLRDRARRDRPSPDGVERDRVRRDRDAGQ